MADPLFFATPAELRRWFEKNHATAKEASIGYYKRDSGVPSITWPESVDQALCFGWIDGVRNGIDDKRYRIRFTPRKTTSIWSTINIGRVKELTKLGLMKPAGLAAFEARSEKKSGVYSFEQAEASKLPAAFAKQLKANPKASAFFEAQPPWYQRSVTHWIVSAKKDETKEKRLADLIACSAAGRTVAPFTRP